MVIPPVHVNSFTTVHNLPLHKHSGRSMALAHQSNGIHAFVTIGRIIQGSVLVLHVVEERVIRRSFLCVEPL